MDANDNELAYLEAIHFFVEVLDSFFGNVCELDLVFNFYKVRRYSLLVYLGFDARKWGLGWRSGGSWQESVLTLHGSGLRYTGRSFPCWRDRGDK